jgi:putative endopeptidase
MSKFKKRTLRRRAGSSILQTKTKKKQRQPIIPLPRQTIKAGNDFYTHINGNWLRHVHMPPYLSSYGASEELEEIIETDLFQIINNAVKQRNTVDDSNLKLIGDYVHAITHTASQENNVRFLQCIVNKINCARDTAEIASTLGDFARYRIGKGVFTIYNDPMETNSKKLYTNIAPGELGLPDYNYYLDKSHAMLETTHAYARLLHWLGEKFGVAGLEGIIAIEKDAAEVLKKTENEMEVLMTGAAIQRRFKYFDWSAFVLTAMRMKESEFRKGKYLLKNLKWCAAVNKWMKNLTVDQWKLWLAAQVILYSLPYLPPPFDDAHYEFFGRRLRGQGKKIPQKYLALYSAERWLAAPLGKLYLKNYFDNETKIAAEKMAREILDVAKSRMKKSDWLSAKSKIEAVKKIEALTINVGKPDPFDTDYLASVKLSTTNFLDNIMTLGEAETVRDLKLDGTTLQPKVWHEGVFTVNAFYYPEGNRIILPAGILRPPFLTDGLGWSYGALGSTIGHELTHAFDVEGKEYDSAGNYNPWWSAADDKKYLKLSRRIVKLYETASYFGKKIDGKLTLSENIADLGGLAFALEALKKIMEEAGLDQDRRERELRDFFVGYAVSWRVKERKKKARQSIFMDLHAPAIVRVNYVVSQFDDWYRIFNVKKGDDLFIDPEDRIHLF